jgi:hypothetical protein
VSGMVVSTEEEEDEREGSFGSIKTPLVHHNGGWGVSEGVGPLRENTTEGFLDFTWFYVLPRPLSPASEV